MGRLDLQHDQKLIGRMAKNVANESLNTLTYDQLSLYLESLLVLQYRATEDFTMQVVSNLELRQKQLTVQDKEAQASSPLR
jgi:hypothetical protein